MEEKKENIQVYDFRRPTKLSKDQLMTLKMMHETFARLSATSLSIQLRSLVSLNVASVDLLTYQEFIRSIPNPTTLAIFNMEPLNGVSVLEIDPSISFTIIDRLFGGKGESSKIIRELSDIELETWEGLVLILLNNLRASWSTLLDLKPELGNLETNPNFAQIVPGNDIVVLITLETKIDEVEGMINLCIPYITIEPILFMLRQEYWYISERVDEGDETSKVANRILSNSIIKQYTEYKLDKQKFKLSDIQKWQKGQRIIVPKQPQSQKIFNDTELIKTGEEK